MCLRQQGLYVQKNLIFWTHLSCCFRYLKTVQFFNASTLQERRPEGFMILKKLIKKILPKQIVEQIETVIKSTQIERYKKLDILTMQDIKKFLIKNMGIKAEETIFVHSNFTGLKLDGTADELIDILVDVIGSNGNILMPFYPIKPSFEWLENGKVFDLRKNRTSMGALPVSLAKKTEARKSIHPTKSVVVLGRDRDFIISEHHLSMMPYGHNSPYYKISLLRNSKIIGLGVTADYLSCMHVAVDICEDYPIQPYHPSPLEGKVIDYNGNEIIVKTYAHDLAITSQENVKKFLKNTKCKTYKEYKYKGRIFFSVYAEDLINHTISQGKLGITFFPSNLNHKQLKRIQ